MDAIGNDIIALTTIDVTRTRTPRFYKKILADTEQQLYRDSFGRIPLEHFVWLLWSVKEAAYKCLQRQSPGLTFSPVNTVITRLDAPVKTSPAIQQYITGTGFNDDHCYRATISFQHTTLYSRSVIYGDEVLHTIASFNPLFDYIHWGIKRISDVDPDIQSSEVRRFLLEAPLLRANDRNYRVEKNAFGQPFISVNGEDTKCKVSLSHHGEWVAYAMK